MCGICGFLQVNNKKVEESSLWEMTEVLTHRGPDDKGIYIKEITNNTNSFKKIGLGHRRLSIIDLTETGHQPMCNDRGDIWIVFNGEIYNFQALKEDLVKKGHRFKGRSDSEVVLHSYEEWGYGSLQRFNGMFAFAIWDERKRTLFLSRDRVGGKPLYYYYKDGNFAFASQLKSLLKYPLFEKELDKRSLYYYLLFQYVPTPHSIFKWTKKLLGGHYLIFKEDGGIEIKKYWDILERKKERKKNEKDYMEEWEELFKSSIKYCLISDVEVGAFLSGGTDSSLVVALMNEISRSKVKTFTIGFKDRKYNEAPYAKRIAKHLQTEHYELYLHSKDIFSLIPKLIDYYDEPFADSSSLPTYLVSSLARKKVKVALSGDGGDELFCGYNRYIWIERMKNVNFLPSFVYEKLIPLAGELPYLKLRRASQILSQKDPLRMYLYTVVMWSEKELKELLGENYSLKELPFFEVAKKLKFLPLLEKLPLVDFHTYLPEDGLTKVDRASMAVSLEVRLPFLDHRVVEFAYSLPLNLRYRRGARKYLLKKLLYKYVPPELLRRPKRGFGIPVEKWLKTAIKPYVEEYLSAERLKREGIFNVDLVEKLVREHLSGKYNYQYLLWTLLQFQLWKERYLD